MKFKIFKNTFLSGFLFGLILPATFIYLFILAVYKGESTFPDILKQFKELELLSTFLLAGTFPNLLIFFQYMRKEYWLGGRGILFSTFLYGILIVYIKFM